MKCGLSLFKTEEDVLRLEWDPETGRSMPRNTRGFGFTEGLWGNKTCKFVKTTAQLTDKHWDDIMEHMANFISAHPLNSDDKNNTNNNADTEMEALNSHAAISLDWCVHHFLYFHKGYLDIIEELILSFVQ